jgi:DNA-binding CsgD family transcriptional regulator
MEGRRPRVRLAELVASLSLGVDLGFGQPMGHVLRQCLIALRLAGRSGLDEQARGAVYYTALLVNVGCHADAHEQAKWFGDDIALKSGKYLHELGSVRGALAAMRLVGAGNPPLYRFRVGLEFALSGRREVDGMIAQHAQHAQHARLARTLAEQLGLPAGVREAVGAAYEQWDGRGWPGELGGEAVPVAARIAQLAEVRAGRLDGAAVDKVLDAAGHRVPRRRTAAAGLTAREVEVLILLARGMSNKQVAARLVITPKTAGNHVEHIYAKIGASSRAAAAMFAVQHGLLPEEEIVVPPR